MVNFYKKYFPAGLHKLSDQDISFCEQLLKESYSNDVIIPIFLSMLALENLVPTFCYPEDWDSMLDIEKAYDTLWREGLLIKLYDLGVRGRMLNWIKDFLHKRTIEVRIGGTFSENMGYF